MTDPSSDDPDGVAGSGSASDVDRFDGDRPGGVRSDGDSVDSADPAGQTESADPADPTEPADPIDAVDTTEPGAGDSTAKTIASAVGVGVLGVLAYVALSFVFALVGQLVGGFSLVVSLALSLAVGQYLAFGGVGLLYLRSRGFDRSRIVSYIGIRRPSAVELVIAFVGAVATFGVAIVLSTIVLSTGAEPAQNQGAQVAMQNPAIIPLIVVAMFLVVGPCEEFLFRGVVQSRLRESLSAAPAIVIASAVFAPAHVISLSGGGVTGVLLGIGLLVIPSFLFGAVYEYTGNLVVVALMHGTYNSILLSLLYIAIAYGPELEDAAASGATLLPI